jgi:hypothetical protein
MSTFREITRERAWRILRDLSGFIMPQEKTIIIRISSFKGEKKLRYIFSQYEIEILYLQKFKKPWPYNFLPIPAPNIVLSQMNTLNTLESLARDCDEYLLIEVLIISSNIANEIVSNITQDSLSNFLTNCPDSDYFFYGVDFDNPESSTDVMESYSFNYIPSTVGIYFPNQINSMKLL